MKPEEYKYDNTKKFIEDTSNVEEFHVERYTTPAMSAEEYEKFTQDKDRGAVPIKIFNFPWNEDFEGLVVQIGKINIAESEDGGSASLQYEYGVFENPNDLPLAKDDEESRDNPDNELLDVFIGRVVESLLYRMSRDEKFLEKVGETLDE